MELRVLRSGFGHPTFNMGLDEALLLSTEAPPTLRFYRWKPFGLSLGYFQERARFADVPGDYVVVRRLTGGGAILHGDELTFSLTLDAGLLPGDIARSYDRIHDAVRRALAAIGVPTGTPDGAADHAVKGLPDPSSHARPAVPWCFADPSEHDLVTAHGKLLGSAQRRIKRPKARVLHHGSLVLRPPSQTPFCGSVGEFVDPDQATGALEAAIIRELAAAFGWTPRDGELSPAERAQAEALAVSRYANDAFTNRR